jgi:hypothetical protein
VGISNRTIFEPLQNDVPAKTHVFPDVKCSEFIGVLINPGGFHAQSGRYLSYGQEFRRSFDSVHGLLSALHLAIVSACAGSNASCATGGGAVACEASHRSSALGPQTAWCRRPEIRPAPRAFLPSQPTHEPFALTLALLSNATALICFQAIRVEVASSARMQRLSTNTAVISHSRTFFPFKRLFR